MKTRIEDIPVLQEIERRATTLFAGTGLLPDATYEGAQVADEAFHRAAINAELSFTARIGTTAVGFVLGIAHPDSFYLAEMSVDPAFGRRGLGRELVQHFCSEAWMRGAQAVTLSTFRDVPWNAPFYAHLGFVEIPREDYTDWMHLYQGNQTRMGLDVSKRLFMSLDRPQT